MRSQYYGDGFGPSVASPTKNRMDILDGRPRAERVFQTTIERISQTPNNAQSLRVFRQKEYSVERTRNDVMDLISSIHPNLAQNPEIRLDLGNLSNVAVLYVNGVEYSRHDFSHLR